MSNRCVILRFGAPLIDKHRSPSNPIASLSPRVLLRSNLNTHTASSRNKPHQSLRRVLPRNKPSTLASHLITYLCVGSFRKTSMSQPPYLVVHLRLSHLCAKGGKNDGHTRSIVRCGNVRRTLMRASRSKRQVRTRRGNGR